MPDPKLQTRISRHGRLHAPFTLRQGIRDEVVELLRGAERAVGLFGCLVADVDAPAGCLDAEFGIGAVGVQEVCLGDVREDAEVQVGGSVDAVAAEAAPGEGVGG